MPISLVIIVPKREEKLIQALGLGNPGPIGTTLTNLINGTTSALEMRNFELDVNEQAGTHCSGELVCNTEMNRGNYPIIIIILTQFGEKRPF